MNERRHIDIPGETSAQAAELLGPEETVPTLAELERAAIRKAMKLTRGSIARTAKMLGMGRATLYRKLAAMESV